MKNNLIQPDVTNPGSLNPTDYYTYNWPSNYYHTPYVEDGSRGSKHRQVLVAVFDVHKDKDGIVKSTQLIISDWFELKPGQSLELTVAKILDDYNPETIQIKEILSFSF
jgi:hypothetical protein